MTVKAPHDKVLVKVVTREDEAKAELNTNIPGFQMSTPKFQGVPDRGEIYDIGTGAAHELAGEDIMVGDMVVFSEQSPSAFKHEGNTLFALEPDQILAKITEAK